MQIVEKWVVWGNGDYSWEMRIRQSAYVFLFA